MTWWTEISCVLQEFLSPDTPANGIQYQIVVHQGSWLWIIWSSRLESSVRALWHVMGFSRTGFSQNRTVLHFLIRNVGPWVTLHKVNTFIKKPVLFLFILPSNLYSSKYMFSILVWHLRKRPREVKWWIRDWGRWKSTWVSWFFGEGSLVHMCRYIVSQTHWSWRPRAWLRRYWYQYHYTFYLFINLLIWHVGCLIFFSAHGIFRYNMRSLSWGLWDLVPWLGVEPGPPALGAQSLNHWTTREVTTIIHFIPLCICTLKLYSKGIWMNENSFLPSFPPLFLLYHLLSFLEMSRWRKGSWNIFPLIEVLQKLLFNNRYPLNSYI